MWSKDVRTLAGEQLYRLLKQQGIRNERVLKAITGLPRNEFVDEAMSHKAWDNSALPIGFGQTISQPYIVARMTEALLQGTQLRRVLEIGTGSGFQTAVLAQLVDEVYTIERIKPLQYQARRRLQRLDLHNVRTKHGDGWQGWASKAPFDAIIVTAAASSVPAALLEQLADGGRMVIPVGGMHQTLWLYQRQGDDMVRTELEAVRFVPLIQGDLE
ncbi:protein-L-isoaspartate(D-aspartate) O-methyltransferase [Oceanimonas baumannii]|uniref:Protein-L-isoaspartate O-methyltransferase n=1 Tax=Oceanimonas baumannii TaxID=129578 RepID=A0A235CM43_9GAMM|nr:protein-L-isoaspartate(D-aspartate) O-methyltransferase [Oceanimonas baumannii]OYD25444.1 protein-L-isoaspartate O-methyltransferase [Oceanimonas baumannii]TDW61358.1 protein-L-isoaspartate(D-aspartate) O-methyltransferase [Oceanimonas baumannii]